ncbi:MULTISPECIES: hypothetical protein [unclassified Microcoleus]|uniref:hypothetical protein n=1 Tax=unclassified Microcoleus TaxID=2642155 RepID=UPI0026013AAD|nr:MULTISPECIES: hypothetical protein [unclassified Microcoleus]
MTSVLLTLLRTKVLTTNPIALNWFVVRTSVLLTLLRTKVLKPDRAKLVCSEDFSPLKTPAD